MQDRLRMVAFNTPMPVRPHFADVFSQDGAHCPVCCELAFEAWERMTDGGINGRHADQSITYWRLVTGRNIAYTDWLRKLVKF